MSLLASVLKLNGCLEAYIKGLGLSNFLLFHSLSREEKRHSLKSSLQLVRAKTPEALNLLSVAFCKIFFAVSVCSAFLALQEGSHVVCGPPFFVWHPFLCFLLASPILVVFFCVQGLEGLSPSVLIFTEKVLKIFSSKRSIEDLLGSHANCNYNYRNKVKMLNSNDKWSKKPCNYVDG